MVWILCKIFQIIEIKIKEYFFFFKQNSFSMYYYVTLSLRGWNEKTKTVTIKRL